MASPLINQSFVAAYFGGKKCKHYKRAIDIKNHLEFHFDGYFRKTDPDGTVQSINEKLNPYFKRLIDTRRPSESIVIQSYRRDIYLPITKIPCNKIVNSLKKIVRSPDWDIDYTHTVPANSLPEKQTLRYYCEEDYPFFDSIENWAYMYVINQMFKDPNAVIVVLPTNINKEKNEWYKPYSYIVSCRNVYDYSENEYLVYEDKESDLDTTIQKLKILTTDCLYEVVRAEGQNDAYIITETLRHNLGVLPAFIMGGVPVIISDKKPLFESFVSCILPGLDAAARTSSDADAEEVQHVFSTMWYYSSQECNACHGTGKVIKAGKQAVCTNPGCENGTMHLDPYKNIVLKAGELGENQIKGAPAGYITKPTEMMNILTERVKSYIYQALSSVNMEFLAETPLAQSGIAKATDKDELDNFAYSIAYHLVENILRPIYYYVNEWRYNTYIPNPETREAQLPSINIPERFDLITANVAGDLLKQAIDGKFPDSIIENLTLEYISKQFSNHPEILEKEKVKKELDPFTGATTDQKQQFLLTGDIPKKDVIISLYIQNFITQAIIDNPGTPEIEGKSKGAPSFLKLDHNAQMAIIDKYCEAKLKETEPSEKVKANIDKLNQNPDEL
jgi:hypothetical protein